MVFRHCSCCTGTRDGSSTVHRSLGGHRGLASFLLYQAGARLLGRLRACYRRNDPAGLWHCRGLAHSARRCCSCRAGRMGSSLSRISCHSLLGFRDAAAGGAAFRTLRMLDRCCTGRRRRCSRGNRRTAGTFLSCNPCGAGRYAVGSCRARLTCLALCCRSGRSCSCHAGILRSRAARTCSCCTGTRSNRSFRRWPCTARAVHCLTIYPCSRNTGTGCGRSLRTSF